MVGDFIIFFLFFFLKKRSPERGPEGGPKRGPKGGSRREGPRFVYTPFAAPPTYATSRPLADRRVGLTQSFRSVYATFATEDLGLLYC